jgi:amino acid adenylation domain-containing protein
VTGSIGARFLQVAEARAGATALRSPHGAWTFAQLSADATALAGGIAEILGAEHPRPVALIAAHDGPLVVGILATVLAGHVVVVLDPTAPEEQLTRSLDAVEASLVLHDEAHDDLAARAVAATTRPARAERLDALRGSAPLRAVATPRDPAMLAFTSGTSGEPKAATITHGVLLNLVRGATNALGITERDCMPMLFPTSLAVAAYPMFLPLLNGGTLATLDVRSVGLAPIADFLTDERITLAYLAPTVVRFLVDSLSGRSFPDLRMIALGGELVDAEVVRLTVDLLGPDLVANGFGTTETGVITLYVMDPDVPLEGAAPAGYPVAEVDLCVLDDHGHELPAGETGEVAITSPHVFSGYWGHPELSAQVLEPDPRGRPGWVRYRTGDLGRLDHHGALTVLGRLDTKVKVRGRFVVLGDVESDLHALDGVADAAVVAVDRAGVVELVAILVASGTTPLEWPKLRRELLRDHEAYRVPARAVVPPELPRLPNGKVDRQALTALAEGAQGDGQADATAAGPGVASVPVGTNTEDVRRSLRDLWELLLPVPVVALDDDFFDLGGHSLLAAQMVVMAEHRLGVTIPMSALVDARTVRTLADVVVALGAPGNGPTTTVARVQQGASSRPRLWFVHDLPGSAYRVRHVARHLGADQPVWSFESPLLRGEPNRFGNLDAFVARYVRDLVEAQPEGPYWLAGYSFGGICAYQMARELRAQGRQVAFVGIVDVGPGYRGPNWQGAHSPPWPYFGVPYPPSRDASTVQVIRHYAGMLRATPRGAARHLTLRTGLARPIDSVRFAADLRRDGRIRPEWRLWYAWEEHWKLATKAWDRGNTYDGRVDFLWASQTGSTDGSMGWGDLVDDLHIHRFEGFHDDLLEERGAPALGAALRSVLDDRMAQRADLETT